MNTEKKRITYLDIAKGIGILMITYGHITKIANPVDNFISIVKVPIFFIVAGILFGMNQPYKKMGIGNYFIKLIKSIGIPYLFFSIVYMFMIVIQSWFQNVECLSKIKTYIYYTITLRGCTTLWFLPCFILAEVIFFLIMKRNSKWVFGVLFLVLPVIGNLLQVKLEAMNMTLEPHIYNMIAPPYLFLSKSIVFVWFIEAGYLCYYMIDKWAKNNILCIVTGIFILCVTWGCSKICTGIDLNKLRFGTMPVLFFFVSALGCFGLILVIRWMCQYLRFPILTYFGKNSLGLMTVHTCFFVLEIVEKGWKGIFSLSDHLCRRYYLETAGILVVTLLLSYAIIEIINKYFPFLFGKKHIPIASVLLNDGCNEKNS